MTLAFTDDTEIDIEDVSTRMAEKITEALASGPETAGIIRISVRVRGITPLGWLNQQPVEQKIYWADRNGENATAGVGTADLVRPVNTGDIPESLQRIEEILKQSVGDARYFGGQVFDFSDRVEQEWAKFGRLCFWLPRFELTRTGGITGFACNLLPIEDAGNLEEILDQLKRLSFEGDFTFDKLPEVTDISRAPDKTGWQWMIEKALGDISRGALEKIVLARTSTLKFSQPPQPLALLGALSKEATDCYAFCFQPDEGQAFLGATPERLYFRTGEKVRCEAVAGTRPRGETKQQDESLAAELQENDKDVREHQFVVRSIVEALNRLGVSNPEGGKSPMTLLKLARVQHLVTRFELDLKSTVSDAEILGTLHPTAAVGGYPREKAVGSIRGREQFYRGWYAGPIGWIGRGSAEFAVAIRSGLLTGSELRLFAGAGIVDGSEADDEWNETESKISNFMKALVE